MKIKIYTDGACAMQTAGRPGGWGAYIIVGEDEYVQYGGAQNTTNQQMEILACTKGLEFIRQFENIESVEIYSDSAYVCNCFNQKWWISWKRNGWVNAKKEPVANKELWVDLLDLYDKYFIEFIKVKGHAGNPGNEKANELAQSASDRLKKEMKNC